MPLFDCLTGFTDEVDEEDEDELDEDEEDDPLADATDDADEDKIDEGVASLKLDDEEVSFGPPPIK